MMHIENIASLSLETAEQIAAEAIKAAQAAGIAICVTVTDRAGYPLVFKRQPGASFHSIDIACDKAYTAVSFGRPTADWDRRLAKGSELLRHGLIGRERFVGFGGGLPIKHDGKCVGAIGVSGGSEAQDVELAEAALAAVLTDSE